MLHKKQAGITMIKTIQVFCFLLVVAFAARCQDFPMLHYTEKDGLPSNNIYSIYRDSRGFLWFATDKGVARYNGIRFEIFTTFNGLPDNEIFFFLEDRVGRLWLGTYNGELCYFKDDTFHTSRNTPFLQLHFKASYIKQMTLEQDGSVNVIYTSNPFFININGDHYSVLDMGRLTENQAYGDLIFREKTGGGRYRFVFTNKIVTADTPFTREHIVAEADNKFKESFSPLYNNYFGQNANYIVTDKYVFNTNLDILTSNVEGFYHKKILYSIYHNGRDWFLTSQTGIYINDSINILADHKISCLTQDNQGNFWASTLDDGVFVINKDIVNAKVILGAYKGNADYVHACRNGIVFVTSDKEIDVLANGGVKKLADYARYVPPKIEYVGTPSNFFMDSNDRFYNCFINGGVVIDHVLGRGARPQQYFTNLTINDDIHEICNRGEYLYVNTRSRVVGYDFAGFRGGGRLGFDLLSDPAAKDRIFCMAKARDNSVWYSTISDVYRIDGRKAVRQAEFNNNSFRAFTFCGDYFVGCNHNNELLICNNAGGKVSLVSRTIPDCIWDKFYKLDDRHVLAKTNNFYRIISLRYSADAPDYSILTVENPFVPLQAEAICADPAKCYFFRNGAITSFDLGSLLEKPDSPKLFFKYLKSGKRLYNITDQVVVSYDEARNLKISYAVISFSSNKTFYQYSLSYDDGDKWVDFAGDELSLYNIGYGTYTVKLRARTISSAWSQPILFKLTVSTPYWAMAWFRLLLICAVISVLVVIVYVTKRLVLNAARKKHQQVELELKSIYSQLNPHFIFNSLNAALFLVKTNRLEDAYQHIYKFSLLLRAYIKSSRNRFIHLDEEIRNLRNYIELQQVRFRDKFSYEIRVDPAVDPGYEIPSLLLQPIVENAITHGLLHLDGKGWLHIDIAMSESAHELLCTIDDNGIGREMSYRIKDENPLKEESYGSQLIKDLILTLNKSGKLKIVMVYTDKVLPQTGTTVTIKIKNIDI